MRHAGWGGLAMPEEMRGELEGLSVRNRRFEVLLSGAAGVVHGYVSSVAGTAGMIPELGSG